MFQLANDAASKCSPTRLQEPGVPACLRTVVQTLNQCVSGGQSVLYQCTQRSQSGSNVNLVALAQCMVAQLGLGALQTTCLSSLSTMWDALLKANPGLLPPSPGLLPTPAQPTKPCQDDDDQNFVDVCTPHPDCPGGAGTDVPNCAAAAMAGWCKPNPGNALIFAWMKSTCPRSCNVCQPNDKEAAALADWTQWGGAWYKWMSTPKDWASAEADCQARKGHLASLHSPEEDDYIRKYLIPGLPPPPRGVSCPPCPIVVPASAAQPRAVGPPALARGFRKYFCAGKSWVWFGFSDQVREGQVALHPIYAGYIL